MKDKMRKLAIKATIITIILTCSGCTTLFKWQKQWDQKNNVFDNKANLVGMTESQLKQQLGEPSSVQTSYSTIGRMDFYTYDFNRRYTAMGVGNVQMHLILTNGVVTSVSY